MPAQQKRLFRFGRGIDEDRPCFFKDLRNLGPQLFAQFVVEVRQRLVQQHQPRVLDQSPRKRAALLLPARQFQRLAVQHRRQLHQIGGLAHGAVDLVLGFAQQPHGAGDVVVDGHRRVVDELLIHHRHTAILNAHAGDILAVPDHLAGVGHIQPRHQPHQGGLARRCRPQQHVHGAGLQLKICRMNMRLAVYDLGHALQNERHVPLPFTRQWRL